VIRELVVMSRKKTSWGAAHERTFASLAKQGLTAGEIAARLTADGCPGASKATVGRRLRDVRGVVRARKANAGPRSALAEAKPDAPAADDGAADVPTDPEELEAAPLAQLEWWLVEVKAAFEAAKVDRNVAAQASLAARATALLEARRKAAPPEREDPNAYPDLVAAAASCKAKLRARLDRALKARRDGL
jgi:hypothetical protein